jgi:hypothetical protein
VSPDALAAASLWRATKSSAVLAPGRRFQLAAAGAPAAAPGALAAAGSTSAASGRAGASVSGGESPSICRCSWRAIISLRPPGRPVSFCANWTSSSSVPILVPELSSMPLAIVAWRMLFISSCMNSDSNCLAVSAIAARGLLPALACSERSALASSPMPGRFMRWPR